MNQRALEAGARALCKSMHGNAKAEYINGYYAEHAAAVITAYEAHLKAEGFVVVRAEPTEAMLDAGEATFCGGYSGTPVSTPKAVWTAMLSAATTGENDASD